MEGDEGRPATHIAGSLGIILWQGEGLINYTMSLLAFFLLLSPLLLSVLVTMCACHSH